ncbi:DUF1653 domain-containing protein [Mycolicibacterium sp. PAM1]|uniref:DUF1653 domain-containing protein n=1 Tax=Mycolicibacterium sp. PAM1 TaxID=2853535 RepID=UPI0027E2C7D7|nr:DUF1653 domain-containing protein [Mycolicibacterium sp. PAM1]
MAERALGTTVRIDYVNYRGERAKRTITPVRVWYGETDWHAGKQWLLEGFDHDREAVRNYALADIVSWENMVPAEGEELPKCGIYRHFKGQLYQVLDIASDSESQQAMVVYRTLYGQYDLWVRPASMFAESVMVDGCKVPRFTLISGPEDC